MTARRLPYPRIIDFLRDELMVPFELTQTALAKATGIPLARINQILLGKCTITPDTDLRLCRYFGLSDGYFLRWQLGQDLADAQDTLGERVRREVKPRPRSRETATA